HPHRILQTLQAQVLLSYYYLRSARPVEGRYHSATAVFLALDAGLHMLSSPNIPRAAYPPFPVVQMLLTPATGDKEVAQRINAFWAAWILNNYWVAVGGTPSAIPTGLPIDTPWP
ncbi:hypothetical protein B0H17DRAFT_908369, partial [Mycena rosella]